MARLRGSEVVHVPNTTARGNVGTGTFRSGITQTPPSSVLAPLQPLADALGGVLGGLAGGQREAQQRFLGNGGPGEAQAGFSEPACVQQLHVSCGAGHAHGPSEYGDEPGCPCCCEDEGLY